MFKGLDQLLFEMNGEGGAYSDRQGMQEEEEEEE